MFRLFATLSARPTHLLLPDDAIAGKKCTVTASVVNLNNQLCTQFDPPIVRYLQLVTLPYIDHIRIFLC
jgi:hypothetical protein